jgi:hypothetical protein
VAAADVLQRLLDAGGQRISNLGAPAAASDATYTDTSFTPLANSGTGSPGTSFLAAPRDHYHPAVVAAAGDFSWLLSGDDVVAANKMRTFAGDFQIEDAVTLTVEDGGVLAVV